MSSQISTDRGAFWPIAFGLLGTLNIIDYFYKLSFQPEDLLKGLGFLFVVPQAYLHPSAFSLRSARDSVRAASWTTWLAGLGLVLVTAGFAAQWL